ncbi:hypothetical protein FLACOL7796_00777 [Flavobacterium collinsii]|uniref:DUF4374 domain-containing protein n=2 Tax=Flavobacterium collinsii TaxID=1114861 RepID=A0ABN7EFQ5_9FLAO|nr:hypothetical protein FLACOL7796_00777 [Flavobacterium collinsii]
MAFASCSHEEEKSSENKPVVVEEIKDKDKEKDTNILSGYSSFEVDVKGTPYSIEDVVNTNNMGHGNRPDNHYGFGTYIDFEVNDNNTVDVFWRDKNATTNAGRNITRISLDGKNVLENIVVPPICNVKDSRFIGFLSIKNDNEFVIGHSEKVNATDAADSVAVFTKFDKFGAVKFRAVAFGSKGACYSPGQASTNVMAYNKQTNSIGVHFGFLSGGHQAGWVSFIDNVKGNFSKDSKGNMFGRTWYLSHNFDQRIMASGDKFYTLGHGDAGNNRALAVKMWNQTDVNPTVGVNALRFFSMVGYGSGNETGTKLGDFIELPNGNVAITYCTRYSRAVNDDKRDLKIVIVKGLQTGNPEIVKETWLTQNTQDIVGWGMQLALYGDNKILVGWNQFNGTTPVGSYFTVCDFDGNVIAKTEESKETLFNHGQSMKITKDGKKLVFVSAGSGNKLKINTINIK